MNIDIKLPIIVSSNDMVESADLAFSQLDLDLKTFRFLTIDSIGETEEDGVIYPIVYSGGFSFLVGMTVIELDEKINNILK